MNRQRISFREALKKQIGIYTAFLIIVVVVGYRLFPLDSIYKTVVFLGVVVIVGVTCITWVRRAANLVLCSKCEANLYHLIEGHGPVQLEINYCPVCGERINV